MSTSGEGWYQDPRDAGTLRWWTGTQWTDATRPQPQPASARPPLGPGWSRIAVAVQVLLALLAAFAVYIIVTNRIIVDVYNRVAEDPTSVPESDALRADLLSTSHILEPPLILACGILFITWLYQAHRSDRMEPGALQHKSGWAIGGWFVPIMNLWRPNQMVTDVRRGAAGTRSPLSYPVQGLWWGAFVVWTILDRIAGRLYLDAGRVPEDDFALYVERFEKAAAWDLWRCVLEVAAAVLAIILVRHLTSLVKAPRDARA